MDILFKHYGVDWLAMFLTMIALYRLGNQKRDGFLYGLASNLAWAAFGVLVFSVANVLANAVFLVMNVRGYRKWRNEQNNHPHPTHHGE